MTLITLRVTHDYYGTPISAQFPLEYTPPELITSICETLQIPFNPSYRALLRDRDLRERWLSPHLPLSHQDVFNDHTVILLVPSALPDASIPSYATCPSLLSPDLQPFYVQLSDYELLDRLGHGAFGVVRAAKHRISGASVAIKELSIDLSSSSDLHRFERELRALATLKHGALLALTGFAIRSNFPSIVTPLLKNGSLQDLLLLEKRGLTPPAWTAAQRHAVLFGVAAGMAAMHAARWVHRDLKPLNILLDDGWFPQICDFGLSKFVREGETLSQTIQASTLAYMAPEMFQADNGDFSAFAADVYAYAVVAYQVVAGLDPWPGTITIDRIARTVIAGERPAIPAHVATAYTQLIQACWAHAPRERPPFAAICEMLCGPEFGEFTAAPEFVCYHDRIAPETAIKQGGATGSGPAKRAVDALREMADGGDVQAQLQYARLIQSQLKAAESFRYFKMAADRNSAAALVHCGCALFKGDGCDRDLGDAREAFRRAADLQEPDGQVEYAKMLLYGQGGARDEAAAVRLLETAARNGSPFGQFEYAFVLDNGLGIQKRPIEAIEWYKRSSASGYPRGMHKVAVMYHTGQAVRKNMSEAVRLYKRAADDGYSPAYCALARIYLYGHAEIQPDPDLAARCAKAAADGGDFAGMIQYAKLLQSGIGVPKNPQKAEAVLKVAHSPQYSAEQTNHGVDLQNGRNGWALDREDGARYFEIAANNGFPYAMYNIGACYERGIGVAVDLVKAVQWYEKAVGAGSDQALYAYAVCLEKGVGIARNLAKALEHYVRAGEKGVSDGWLAAGMLLAAGGEGLTANEQNAVEFYRRAAERRNAQATLLLGMAYEAGKGVARDLGEAAVWYRRAAQLDDEMAMRRLVAMLESQQVMALDPNEYWDLLHRLAEKGSFVQFPWSSLSF